MIKNSTAKFVLLLIILHQCSSFSLRNHKSDNNKMNHQYWFTKYNPVEEGDDDRWYYCDYKCLTLQKFVSNKDFVFITFTAPLKQQFAACYVKTGNSYTLWSKVVENAFYEKYCGEDYKDWAAQSEFTIKRVDGVGIGTAFNETQLYTKKK